MGLRGMVISGVAAVAGAIMYFATTAQSTAVVRSHGFQLSTVGVILMIAGAAGFAISLIIYSTSRRVPPHTMDRQVVDELGRQASVHEERR